VSVTRGKGTWDNAAKPAGKRRLLKRGQTQFIIEPPEVGKPGYRKEGNEGCGVVLTKKRGHGRTQWAMGLPQRPKNAINSKGSRHAQPAGEQGTAGRGDPIVMEMMGPCPSANDMKAKRGDRASSTGTQRGGTSRDETGPLIYLKSACNWKVSTLKVNVLGGGKNRKDLGLKNSKK